MKLARIILVATLGLCAAACVSGKAADPEPFAGTWEEEVTHAGRSVPYSVLTVELRVAGDQISGSYCFVTHFGKKIDCDPQSGDNIRGRVGSDGVANITFDSTFGGIGGQATLHRTANDLRWETIKPPQGGTFYGPNSALLQRAVRSEPVK